MSSPRELPDVAALLFTNEYRAVKLKGRPKRKNHPGTGSGPPRTRAFLPRPNPPDTAFRRAYERGDLPVAVEHRGLKNVIRWQVAVESLDYVQYLPLFFDGVRETQEPFRFLAVKGVEDLLAAGGDRVLLVVPQLVMPIKRALDTRDPQVMTIALQLLQKLACCAEGVGPALVPYFRQLLPVCAMYGRRNRNLGDGIDYAQHEGGCLGEVVQDTLALLQLHGGPTALASIKYMVPTYESAINY